MKGLPTTFVVDKKGESFTALWAAVVSMLRNWSGNFEVYCRRSIEMANIGPINKN